MATAAKKTAPLKRATKAPAKPKPAAKRATGTARKKHVGEQAPLVLTTPAWTTACPDWEQRIVANETLTPCDPLFMDSAALGMQTFDDLMVVDAGVNFGTSRPWIREFAAAIFGAYCMTPGHPEEARRLIQTFFMLISKKNAKSTTAAGIMLTALILNWRPEGEFYILAPTKEVADNSWKPLRAAVLADDDLSARFTIKEAERTLVDKSNNAFLKVVAADTQTVTGKKTIGVLVDELHEFGKVAKAETMLVEITGGLASRPEGFVIYLTTQSDEPPAGVFKKELDYARAVRDGKVVDPSYYPILYEYPAAYLDPDTKPYMLPENWHIVNPNWGITVDPRYITGKIDKAKFSGEDSIQKVVSKHLNIQIGLDLGADAWPAARLWMQAAQKPSEGVLARLMLTPYERQLAILDEMMDQCEVLTAGVDGGGLDDLLALTFTGRLRGTTDQYLSWSHAWCSKIVLERRMEIAPRLKDFEAAGQLTIVETLGPDVTQLAEVVKRVQKRDLLHGLGIDPARIASIITALRAEELPVDDDDWFVKVRQGWTLASSILWVERGLATGNYKHMAQALVNWAVGNAKVVARANSFLVTKELSGAAKIDPLMSSFCAAELMSHNPAARIGGYSLDALQLMG